MSGELGTVVWVFRRELGARFDSMSALTVTIVFALVAHGLYFFLGHPVGDLQLPSLWAGRVASLQVVFAWLPLLFVGLIPALTMGAWAEERASGTEELLFTWPVSGRASVLGKFLAVWFFLGLVLTVAILPLAIMVSSLGNLDWGTVFGGLLGAFLLAGACIAISLFLSSLFSEQLSAFLSSALLLGLLWSAGLLVHVMPPGLADAVFYTSPYAHFFDSAARGVFDLRDLIYHTSLMVLGLWCNTLVVEGRRWA
ncbi:MAG: ABC transporter permease [Planctomycetota bacterium]|nr:ABC transporter permease [Planctomycetota bacterium]